jgi:RNA polymerase sigma-70 factor (ECF subfamily)
MQHSLNCTKNIADMSINKTLLNIDEKSQLCNWMSLVATDRDKHAFSNIFNWFAPKIVRFGIKQLNNETTANVLLQETMTNVWKKAHMYNAEKGAVTTWVYTIMRNISFDMLRKVKSNREDMFSDDIWPLVESEQIDSTDFEDHLLNKNLMEYVEKLPQAQKQIIKGVYFQELSQEQIAVQLSIPVGTVKSRLRTALSKLKTHIGDDS